MSQNGRSSEMSSRQVSGSIVQSLHSPGKRVRIPADRSDFSDQFDLLTNHSGLVEELPDTSRKHSNSTKRKIGKAMARKGRCKWCHTTTNRSNLKTHHNDNCKLYGNPIKKQVYKHKHKGILHGKELPQKVIRRELRALIKNLVNNK